jgi:amino-acid N-acetyltransferase
VSSIFAAGRAPGATIEPVKHRCEPAKPHDLGRALELLRQADLPDTGVVEQFGHYLVVRDDELLIGVCGVEVHGTSALLRSVAVERDYRGAGVGDCLVRGALELASGKLRLKALYLLTETAAGYFERYGFQRVERDEPPEEIRGSWEYRTGCPASAVLMKRVLAE